MTNQVPTGSPGHADASAAIRAALLNLIVLHEQRDPRGVGLCEQARDVGMAHQCWARVLHGERAFRLEYLTRLRPSARRAALAALWAACFVEPAPAQEQSACMTFAARAGDAIAEIGRAYEDGELSSLERPRVRQRVADVHAQSGQLLRALDVGEARGRA